MRDSNTGGNQSIQEIEKLRRRVAKLERLNRKLANHKNVYGNMDKTSTEWEMTFNATKDSIMIIDVDYIILRANIATSRFLGKPIEDIIGKTCWQLFHGTKEPPEECPWQKALLTKKHEESELYIPAIDVWVEASVDPIIDEKGVITSFVHTVKDITGRKRAEEALRESEQKYRGLFENAREAIVIIDMDKRITDANKFVEEYGFSKRDLIGRNYLDFVAEQYKEKAVEDFEELRRGIPQTGEFTVVTPKGNVTVYYRDNPIVRAGNVIGVQSVLTDITERMLAEEALLESEERFRTLFESTREGLISADAEGRVVSANPSAATILGYEGPSELIGKYTVEFYEDLKQRGAVLKGIAENGYIEDFEVTVKRKDGTRAYLLISITTEKDEQGHLLRSNGMFRDITERKRAEEALRESEERFRALFEKMPSGVAVYETVGDGEDFVFKDFNSAAEKIEKIKRRELIGKRVTEVFPGVSKFGIFEVFKRVWKTGRAEYFPDSVYKDDHHSDAWRENWIYKLPSGSIVAVYNDITERKQNEQKLRAIADYTYDWESWFGVDGSLLWLNPAVEKLTGYSMEECHEMSDYPLPIVHPEDRIAFGKRLRQAIVERSSINDYSFRISCKDGSIRWMAISWQPIYDDKSGHIGLRTSVRDITERKRDEDALHESQENYRMVSEMTSDYIAKVRVEPDGQLVLVSATDRLENNTGYPLDELRDQDSWSKIVHPDDYDKFQDFWRKIISSRESCELLFRGVDREQQFEWLYAIGKPILDEKNERVISIIFAAKDITERKEAEDALKESELKFRLVTETIEDVFWMSTPGVKEMVYISPSYETIWGSSRESLYQAPKSFMEVVHPDDRDLLTNIVDEQHSVGKPYSCEYRIIPSDGRLRWISERGFPVFDEHRNLRYMTGVCTDITEHKKNRDALVESERRFRSIFNNANDIIVFVTKFGKILEVNTKVKNALGYDSDKLIGKNFMTSGILSIRNAAVIIKLFKEAVNANGFPHKQDLDITEVWLNHKNGRTILFEASTKAIRKDGKLEGFLSILRDVTESRKAQEAYRSLVDHSLQGLTIFQEGRIVFANQAMAKITGYSVDEMLGSPPEKVQAFVHRDDRELVWNRHKERLEGKVQPERYEIRGIRKDGSVRWLEIDACMVEYQGKPAIQAAYIDITERKKAEEKVRQETMMRNILIDYLPCVAVILKKSTREIVASNQAAREIGAVPGKTCYGTCAERDEPCPFCLAPEVWATNEPRRLEVKSNGKYYEGLWVPLSEDLYVHYIFDITERRNTEEAYHSLVDHSLQGHVIFQEGRVVFANQAMAQITGYSVEEMLSSPPAKVREFVHPEDRGLVWNRHKGRLAGKLPPERYEIRGIRKDGSVRWLEIDANLVEYQGKPAIQAAYLDITEIKKAEQQEQEYIRQLQYLSESATEFVKLTPDQDIYMLIAEKLKELSDGSIVAVNTWDHASERLCVRAVLGLGKYTQAVTQIMGYNPLGQYFPLDDNAKEGLGQGKLLKVPNGIYDLSPGIPKMVCQAVEKLLGLGDVYAMGLNSEGRLYGSTTLLTRSKTGLKNHELIETFMNQAAVAIHRWQAAAALRDSEHKYRSLFENARDVIATFDTKGNITDVNKAVEEYGFKREQLIGESLFNYVVEEHQARAIADFEMLIGGHPVSGEMNVITPKGIFTVNYSDNPIMRDKDVVGIQAILKDITERKRAEEALKESEHRFKTLFECAPDGIYLIDMEGKFVDGNKTAEKLIGYKREELIGLNFAETGLLSPEEIPKALTSLEKNINGEPTGPEEFTLIHKNDSRIPVEIRTFPVRIKDQTLTLGIARDISERKKAELQQQRLTLMVESGNEFMGISTLDGKVLYLNEAGRKLIGLDSLEEARKKTIFDFVCDDNRAKLKNEILDELIKNGEVRGDDVIRHFKSGRSIDVKFNLFYVKSPDTGKPISMAVIMEDISERKKAEEALVASEVKYKSLFDNSIEGIGLSRGNHVISANKALLDIFGYDSLDEFTRIPILEHVAPESKKIIRGMMQKRKKGELEQAFMYEYKILRKDGTKRDLEILRTSIQFEGEDYTLSTFRDITERKVAEENLRQNEAFLNTLLDAIPIPVFYKDRNGKYLGFNSAFEEFFGSKRETLIGKTTFDINPEKLAEIYHAKDIELFESGGVQHYESQVINKQGMLRDVIFNKAIYSDNRGGNSGLIGAILDITDRKQAEDRLREYQDKLKALASERLMAEERERKRIAIGFHDDICQKLVISKFTLESSLKSVSDANLSKSLRIVSEALGETIQRAEWLTFELSNPILREFGLVAAMEKYLEEEIRQQHGISYEVKGDKQLSTLGDEVKTILFRIVKELLTNVVKHAQAGKITVSVQKYNQKLCVRIQDDGVGFKIANGDSKTTQTMRFGLFSVREQLDHLGGSLSIVSKPGQGTIATVVVPLGEK